MMTYRLSAYLIPRAAMLYWDQPVCQAQLTFVLSSMQQVIASELC